MTIAVVQFATHRVMEDNWRDIQQAMEQAVAQQAQCIVFPEECLTLGMTPEQKLASAERYQAGPWQDQWSALARQYGLWVVGGTLPLCSPDPKQYYSSCILWNDKGEVVARYDKIHLFDVQISDKEEYRESAYVRAGEALTLVDTPFGQLGMAICYDIRFPELFRQLALKGAQWIVLPSAFTQPTGQAHWEVLVRARAIENLCYMVAPSQVGIRLSGHGTYGHSMVVGPWGEIVVSLEDQPGMIVASLDLPKVTELRKKFPVLEHDVRSHWKEKGV